MTRAAPLLLAALLGACGPSTIETHRDAGPDGARSCEPPRVACASRCADVQSDARNCGACGAECPAGAFCSGGACTRACPSGLLACEGSCVDQVTDSDHCGGCAMPCGPDEVCRGGGCVCPEGFTECSGTCIDPFSDKMNCGVCGRRCANDELCSMGACACAMGSRETDCSDRLDNDCDGRVDCLDSDCYGETRSCMGSCGLGVETCEPGGLWGRCVGGSGEPEICGDGVDQDCDGADLRNPDEWEPNDTCGQCALVSSEPDPNVYLYARFDSVVDRTDCYRFIANDSGSVVREWIDIRLENIPSGHDYDVYLYESLAKCEARDSLARGTNTSNADEHISWGERPFNDDGGTYYVRVVRFRGQSCTDNYRLTINGLR